jgi:hypothetical protein
VGPESLVGGPVRGEIGVKTENANLLYSPRACAIAIGVTIGFLCKCSS